MALTRFTKVTIIALLVVVVSLFAVKLLLPTIQKNRILESSASGDITGEVIIAVDSWIGYYPLQSPVFEKFMREKGYRVVIEDDNADYSLRMQNLDLGKVDFAVCTVDAYLLNGQSLIYGGKKDYPGVIVAVIDESQGGDAIISWEDSIQNLNDLKSINQNYKIAFTTASPSEHLLKSVGIHFGIDKVLDPQGSWRQETMGARDAYKQFIQNKVDVAVLWEPYVTMALENDGATKLLGSEDTEKLIVDVLVVNREFALQNPDTVKLVVEEYFNTIAVYNETPELLIQDIAREVKIDGKRPGSEQINAMFSGVRWLNLAENARWFGIDSSQSYYEEEILQAISSATDILIEYGDFMKSPLPNNGDPWSIIAPDYLETVYLLSGLTSAEAGEYENSLERRFSELKESQWDKISVVGNFKVLPISFMSGTSDLDYNGEMQCDIIAERLSHYPNFRIMIKGHTGTSGNEEANKLLSQERGNAVRDFFVDQYRVDPNRIRSLGMGSSEPLEKEPGESTRSYNYRLKRVEVYLVTF